MHQIINSFNIDGKKVLKNDIKYNKLDYDQIL